MTIARILLVFFYTIWYTVLMGEIITFDNGAQYDRTQGQIVKGANLNRAQASALARARWDKAAAAARQGMALAVSNHATIDVRKQPAKAWGMVVEHLTDVLLATNSARGAADLAAFVGKSSDMLPDKRQDDGPPAGVARIDIPIDTLLDTWRQMRASKADE